MQLRFILGLDQCHCLLRPVENFPGYPRMTRFLIVAINKDILLIEPRFGNGIEIEIPDESTTDLGHEANMIVQNYLLPSFAPDEQKNWFTMKTK